MRRVEQRLADFVPAASRVSIQSTSIRGVMTSRTGRSARRTMPEMIARSLSSSTPAVCASATTRCSSSAVTWLVDSRLRPKQPEDQGAGPVEQPDERRGRDRQPPHRPRHDDRDRLGRAKRELLGHQLADDQRQEGDEDDDDAEADRLRGLGLETENTQALGHRAAEAGARISAGQNADQRDPDLHGRQEAARIGRQCERALRAAAAGLGAGAQPRLARRDDRQLAHREHAVQERRVRR